MSSLDDEILIISHCLILREKRNDDATNQVKIVHSDDVTKIMSHCTMFSTTGGIKVTILWWIT